MFLVVVHRGKEILCFSVCLRAFRQVEMIPLGFILSIVHVGFVYLMFLAVVSKWWCGVIFCYFGVIYHEEKKSCTIFNLKILKNP